MEDKMAYQLKKKGTRCPQNYIQVMCDQLSASPFSYDIELIVLPHKFSTLKCLAYKGMKDHMTHVIHIKITMAPICVIEEKKDVMFSKIFASTF